MFKKTQQLLISKNFVKTVKLCNLKKTQRKFLFIKFTQNKIF